MKQYKVLNIITGGLINDGITNAWLSFCKEFRRQSKHIPFKMDFVSISNKSSLEMMSQYNAEGFLTPSLPPRNSNLIRYGIKLYFLLKKGKYNIIHVNGSSSLIILELFIGWLAGTRVRIAHSRNTTANHKKTHAILKIPLNWIINGRLACGKDAGKWLFGNKEFDIIHNGKNLSKFSYDEDLRQNVRTKLDIGEKFVIGHVGRFNNQKNHQFLINVFEKLLKHIPESVLILIGDGPLESQVRDLIVSKGLSEKVIFTGAVDKVQDFLQGIDMMVFPSKYEGLPNVVLEWQAMGLPSVISDKITNECAVCDLVQIEKLDDNIDDWVQDIVKVYNNYPNRNIKSNEGKKALQDHCFDIHSCANNLVSAYNKLLSNNNKRTIS